VAVRPERRITHGVADHGLAGGRLIEEEEVLELAGLARDVRER
jgi:hypothetical protein